MKKINKKVSRKWVWIIGIIGVIGIIAILIIIALTISAFTCIGCGTQFVYQVMGDGCSKINVNENGHNANFTLTDEMLDSVIIEYGYPASGLKTGTLREFCQRYNKNIENCKEDIALVCH